MDVLNQILNLLDFNARELAVQFVNFLILLAIMRAFFWKPVLKILDERKGRIAEEIKKAEETNRQAEQLKEEFEAKMRTIEEAANARIHEAVNEGKRRAEEIEIKARESAQKAVEHGTAEINFQVLKAKEEIKRKTIELTIQAAEHLVEKNFSADDDKKLVEDFINRVDKMTIG